MSESQAERQPVISEAIFEVLAEFLEFRHVFNNIYGEEPVYEKTEKNAKQIDELFSNLSKELNAFIAYLEE